MPGVVKQIEIPEINPIRFNRWNSPNAGFNTLRPDDWFANQQTYGKVPCDYYQKWTFDMPIVVQIFLGGQYTTALSAPSHKLQLLDCRGNVIKEISYTGTSQIAGNVIRVGNTDIVMKTYNWKTSFPTLNISTEGYYYLRLVVGYEDNSALKYDYWVSEPIYVAIEHPGTVLLEYTSYSNKLNSQFAAPFLQYSMRVEGSVKINGFKRFQSGYKDQKQNPRLQSSEPYREVVFKIGYPGGVPDYILDKINRAFCCDVVSVDRVRYVADTDAEIQRSKVDPVYEKSGATFVIYEYDNDEAGITSTKIPLVLYERNLKNGSPYYCIHALALSNSNDGIIKTIFIGYEITTLAQEDAFISGMNNYWIAHAGLNGYIQRSGNNIVYVNGGGEFYNTTNTVLFTKKIEFLHQSYGLNLVTNVSFNLKAWSAAVVFDKNYEVYCQGVPGATTMTSQSFPYNYRGVSTATIRIWHDNHIDEIHGGGRSWYDINVVDGTVSIKVIDLALTGITSLNLTSFTNALTSLSITDSELANVIWLGSKNWLALTNIYLNNNKIPTLAVDGIFNNFHAGTTIPSNGQFNIKYQNPIAPPTSASGIARLDYISHSWTVNTD